jgi:hypothetical protein
MTTPVEPSSNPATGRMSHHGAPDMGDSRLLAPGVSTDVDQGACGCTYPHGGFERVPRPRLQQFVGRS